MSPAKVATTVGNSLEAHVGKVVASIVLAGIITAITLLVNIDKRLSLVEALLERDRATAWTVQQQETYSTRIEGYFAANKVQLTSMQIELASLKLEIERIKTRGN